MSCIETGKGIILKKGKNLKYVYVSNHKQEKLENFFFSCHDMIGKPFGTAFKVLDKKRLEVIDPIMVEEHAEEYENTDNQNNENTKDNRSIQDNSASQKLSKDEIMSFREEGKSGEEIVQELVDNSATFENRTEYSKAKYRQKKKKKYVAQFVALKPTARLLAQMYFSKNPIKVLEIRPDMLAQLLTWSNIQSGSNVLLMENCQGLIAGAIMERLGDSGKLVQLHQGSFPVRIVMEQFNFTTDDVRKLVCSFPLEKLAALPNMFESGLSNEEVIDHVIGKNKVNENKSEQTGNRSNGNPTVCAKDSSSLSQCAINVNQEQEMLVNEQDSKSLDVKSEKTEQDNAEITTDLERKDKRMQEVRKRKHGDRDNRQEGRVTYLTKEQRRIECFTAVESLRRKNFDSLVMASKYHPKTLLFSLLEFLPRSCPFVVYFTHQEPLMECYVTLREMNIATHLELTESFCRNIQVLNKRTHPEIVMSGTGGYILRGIKVDS